METVVFYSYKGGVGRSLLVANAAQFLALSGRRVVALDLDFEAPGLHQKFGKSSKVSAGAVDELLDMFEGEPGIIRIRQRAIKLDLPSGSQGSLVLIPAGSAPSYAYWARLERLNNTLRSRPRIGGLTEAILELQARIEVEFAPEFLLIDARAGITELGGLATTLMADRVVCLTTTAPESVEGIKIVADALRVAPRLSSQQPLRIEFLITRVTPGYSTSTLVKELGGSAAVLPHDSGIANEEHVLSPSSSPQAEDFGQSLFSATRAWIAESFPAPNGNGGRH